MFHPHVADRASLQLAFMADHRQFRLEYPPSVPSSLLDA